MGGRRRAAPPPGAPAHAQRDEAASRRSNPSAVVIKGASSLLTSLSLYLWMDQTLLPIMRRDAVQMAHLDPTVIIAEPNPIGSVASLTCNAMITLIIICSVGSALVFGTTELPHAAGGHRGSVPVFLQHSLWNLLRSLIVSALGIALLGSIIFLAAILCGASPWTDTRHTVLASGYVAALAFGPSLIFDAKQYLGGSSPANQLKRLLCGPQRNMGTGSSTPGAAFNQHRQS